MQEVKKRDMDILMLDVTYKETKYISQYHGNSVLCGMVIGLNKHNKIRLQFHIYIVSHERMLAAWVEFEKTRKVL